MYFEAPSHEVRQQRQRVERRENWCWICWYAEAQREGGCSPGLHPRQNEATPSYGIVSSPNANWGWLAKLWRMNHTLSWLRFMTHNLGWEEESLTLSNVMWRGASKYAELGENDHQAAAQFLTLVWIKDASSSPSPLILENQPTLSITFYYPLSTHIHIWPNSPFYPKTRPNSRAFSPTVLTQFSHHFHKDVTQFGSILPHAHAITFPLRLPTLQIWPNFPLHASHSHLFPSPALADQSQTLTFPFYRWY